MTTSNIMKSFLTYHVNLKCLLVLTFITQQTQRLTVLHLHLLRKEIDGEKKVGFHIKVGGGLSARPYLADELDVFVLPEEVKAVAIAITTIFRDFEYRENVI